MIDKGEDNREEEPGERKGDVFYTHHMQFIWRRRGTDEAGEGKVKLGLEGDLSYAWGREWRTGMRWMGECLSRGDSVNDVCMYNEADGREMQTMVWNVG